MSTSTVLRPPQPSPPEAPRRSRRWRWLALTVIVPILLGGLALWWFVLRHDTPAEVTLEQAVAGIESPAGPTASSTPATPAAAPQAATPAASIADGAWTIDRTITNGQGSGSFAGFRIGEVLAGVGATTAVGRTPTVEGSVTVAGTTVSAAQITSDLTDVTTNDSRRDDSVQRALATSRFPNATFVLTQPIPLPSAPASGERITVPATGELTIRGVTRSVTIDLQAQLQGNVLVVVGSAPVVLADYGVSAPTAPIVASVEKEGTFEFQLYFKRS